MAVVVVYFVVSFLQLASWYGSALLSADYSGLRSESLAHFTIANYSSEFKSSLVVQAIVTSLEVSVIVAVVMPVRCCWRIS